MKSSCILWIALIVLSMIPLSLASQVGPANSAFSISRSADGSLDLHFELPAWKLEEVSKDGESLQRVSIAETPYLYIGEEETLPIFSTTLAIPYRGGASLSVLNAASESRAVTSMDFDTLLNSEQAAGRLTDTLYPASSVLISEPMILRDFRIVTINVYPFQYDSQTRELKISQSVDLRVSFDNGPSVNEMEAPLSYSSAFESIYRGMILNYDSFRDRTLSYTSPRMLVIYGNYSEANYLAQLNWYVTWKRQKGFIVNAVSTATTGTSSTAIKTYIQTQYNNAATRPDYIVLIGDTAGSMPIPTYSSYIDYYYTWLAGGDNLGDAIIGRISVETSEQMINYMAKVASLEQNLNLDTAAWLNRMVLVADTAQSGISTIYTSEYIEEESSTVNPNYTYTEVYGSPSSATINAAINQGVAIYNYRGYIGMSGWPGTMSSMNNAYRLFHAVFITCATGNFSGGTATTESVVRYGSSSTLGGSVTAIGMATSSTATPQNNCLNYGIYDSIYNHGARDMATAMLAGKLYLESVYGLSAPTEAYNFAAYCNLIGDPTATLYVGIPSTFSLTHETSIPSGAAHLPVTVKNAQNEPVEGARVTATHSSGTQILGFSDQDGIAVLDLIPSLTDSLTLTVSKDDFKPAVSTVIITSAGGIVYQGMNIDDDGEDQSIGNGDGVINAGEIIELYVSLRNTSSVTLTPIAEVLTSDPYFTLLDLDRLEYNPIPAGGTGENTLPILFEIAPNCPDLYEIDLHLQVSLGLSTYDIYAPFTIRSGKLTITAYSFVGAPGNIIDPGNQFPMTISLQNMGLMDISGVYGSLRSHDIFLTVSDSLGYYGNIDQGMTSTNGSNTFTVMARSAAIKGMVIPLSLYLTDGAGFEQTIDFSVNIGQPGLHDPLGQDSYGYFIFDDGDTSYPQCPSYQWIGLAPSEGGSGTALSLTDPGHGSDEGDQVGAVSITTVNLPFTFKFYGVDYTRASISANGFIAFGQTVNSDWRNWRLPGPGGPSPMIAAFWDDLEFGTGSAVYTWYDSSHHYYVVEWHNLLSGYNSSSQETFQAILYDPIFHPTHTGDGQIKLQYKVISNIDQGNTEDHFPHGNFATIGIEDHNAQAGLEYTFNNAYPVPAQSLSNELALLITTRPLLPDFPYLAIEDVLVLDVNGNGHLEPNETANLAISLVNYGLQDAQGVFATLSSSDPYVSITSSSSAYGDIAAQTSANPMTNYAVSVLPSCPSGHVVVFNLAISGSGNNWNYQFPLTVQTAVFELDNQSILDYAGNQNGILDPGETANLSIHLINNGLVASSAGNALLSCSTPGITINDNSSAFTAIAPGAYATLSFNLTASAAMTNGTLVQLNINTTAGSVSYNSSTELEVGQPLVVTIGNGTSTQAYPLDRYYNYSAHEAIYLASEIGMAGSIKSLAFQKSSGEDVNPIEAVSIYMKHTSSSTLSTGNYSTAGYTLVYSGSYPNNATSGWMEVNLSPMFVYDGSSNLSILTVKDFQQWINSYPDWTYSTANSRARQNHSDSAAPTNLASTPNLPNILFRVFPLVDILLPPSNLTASASHQSVMLSWNAPASGTPVSYKLYRNASLLTTVTALSYTDLAVTNGTSYSYYVTALYSNPTGESEPSNSVDVTPTTIEFVIIGTGTSISTNGQNSPINISNNSTHGQLVYTAAELNAAGVTGPVLISGLGFDVVSAPLYPITDFLVRMKHTTATNCAVWQNADGLISTYSNASYMPTAGDWDMLMFSTPFEWNGVDNILVDTAFGLLSQSNRSGTLRYTNSDQSYRFAYSNTADQTNVFTDGLLVTRRYNIRFALQNIPAGPEISVNPSSIPFGNVPVNTSSTQQFSIENTGDTVLSGTITTPTGYSVALAARAIGLSGSNSLQREVLDISVPAGQTLSYTLSFNPTAQQSYNGNVVISSDAINNPSVNISVSGSGIAAVIAVNPTSLSFGNVRVGNSVVRQFSIQNTGSYALSGTIVTPTAYSVSALARTSVTALDSRQDGERNTLPISIPAGQSRSFQLSFSPSAAGSYNGNVVINSNALNSPVFNLGVTGSAYVNQAPVINLPDIFVFSENGSLQVDFSPYVSDPNSDQLTLSASGNTNIIVSIDGLNVSFSAPADWYGIEDITFTVSDGYLQASDSAPVNVIHVVNWLACPAVTISMDASGPLLSWEAIPDANSYMIYRATSPAGPFSFLAQSFLPQYTDTSAPSSAFYYVKAAYYPAP